MVDVVVGVALVVTGGTTVVVGGKVLVVVGGGVVVVLTTGSEMVKLPLLMAVMLALPELVTLILAWVVVGPDTNQL